MSRRPTSSLAACVWIPLFSLRCEEARHDGLAAYPLRCSHPTPPASSGKSPPRPPRGRKAGMTVSQAIGLCPTLRLIESDPVHYDDCFARLLAALNEISPVIESGELGLAYVGCDGLEGIFGSPGKIVDAIRGMMERWNDFHRSIVPSFPSGFRFRQVHGLGSREPRQAGRSSHRSGRRRKSFSGFTAIAVLPLDADIHRRLDSSDPQPRRPRGASRSRDHRAVRGRG